ncbi:MAG: HDOD domain-containing protein [Vitreoscilla sp.]|nr:HDOD domain-containing protein [Vitreoscilla sp.]
MNDGVLDHLILGYGAVFDAKRKPGITRLTLHPTAFAGQPDLPGLQDVLLEHWQTSHGPLALNLTSESWLRALLRHLTEQGPVPQWQVEVPAFVLSDAALASEVVELATRGQPFVLKGRPLSPLSPTLMRSFQCAIIEIDEDRRVPGAAPAGAPARTLPFVQAGAQTGADAAAAFGRGAVGVLGWPLGDPPEAGHRGKNLPAGVRVVMDLMQRLDREEPVGQLEAVLRRDPALGYRLMRYINSPGFGLSVEVNSFSHAIMILGYTRLKRWLALLMTGAIDNPDMRPLMFLAVRRGLLMEELARGLADEALRNEAFICGVFSLLDRMLGQSFEELLRSVPVPERVAHALADQTGELAPSLALAVAIESGLPLDIQQADEAMMLSPGEANRAALVALAASRQLQTD